LPGVDDGARDIDESVAMCKAAASEGVTAIVATPHAFDGVHTTHSIEFLRQKVEELSSRLGGTPRIELACELRFTHDVVNQVCGDKTAPTIAGGPYVLLEFPHYVVPAGTSRVLFELMSRQIRPIIAHPERNRTLMAEPQRFFEMVEMGALGQVDSGSMTGQFGSKVRETAETMLEHGLIHMVASDCHNMRNRLPGLSNALKEIAEIVGQAFASNLANDNPAAAVQGIPIPCRPQASLPTKKKKRFLFF
ncbi:MAG: tyrosine-protein phosphatase, partial [Blastocatellia bacterium]